MRHLASPPLVTRLASFCRASSFMYSVVMEPQSVSITTEYIKLEALLKLANLVSSGGEAKCLIQDGQVSVNGQVCRMRGKKLRPGDRVAFAGRELTVQ